MARIYDIDLALRSAKVEHFTGAEFMNSMPAGSVMPDKYLGNAVEVCKIADLLRKYMGEPLALTSGYRDPEVNRRVGGAPSSSHLTGSAVDLRVMRPTIRPEANRKLRRAACLAWIAFPEVVAGIGLYMANVHVDVIGGGKSRRFWSSTSPKPTTAAQMRLEYFNGLRQTISAEDAKAELLTGEAIG